MLLKPRLQKWLLGCTCVDASLNLFEGRLQLAGVWRNFVFREELLHFITLGRITKDAGVLHQRSVGIIAELSFYISPMLPDKIPSDLAPGGIYHYRTDHLWRILRTHHGRDCEIESTHQLSGIAKEAQHLPIQNKFVLSFYLREVGQDSVVQRRVAVTGCDAQRRGKHCMIDGFAAERLINHILRHLDHLGITTCQTEYGQQGSTAGPRFARIIGSRNTTEFFGDGAKGGANRGLVLRASRIGDEVIGCKGELVREVIDHSSRGVVFHVLGAGQYDARREI